jgi:ABC-type sugar transport system substrate-binding protein
VRARLKNGFLFAPWLRNKGIASFLLVISLTGQAFAEKKLNSVAVTVGDLGNPYFVQIAHGAQDQARKRDHRILRTLSGRRSVF